MALDLANSNEKEHYNKKCTKLRCTCCDYIKESNFNTFKTTLDKFYLKGNVQFIFFCNPHKSSVNACLMKIFKITVTKKVIMYFNKLGEENF